MRGLAPLTSRRIPLAFAMQSRGLPNCIINRNRNYSLEMTDNHLLDSVSILTFYMWKIASIDCDLDKNGSYAKETERKVPRAKSLWINMGE